MPRPLTSHLLVLCACGCFTFRAFGQSLISGPGQLQAISTNVCVANNNCVESTDVWITNISATQSNGRVGLTFTIAGGSNGLAYDVFATPALASPLSNADWKWVGQGFANVTYALPALPDGSNFLLLGTPLDSDGDGLTDAYELLVSHSNPYNSHSITPSMTDGWAVLWSLNPFAIYDQQDFPGAPRVRLGYWKFDNANFAGEDGQLPLVANASLVPSWSGQAVAMTSTDASSELVYQVIETNGLTNFNCANGTIRFWFQPNWSSGNTNAPTNGGYFFRVGQLITGLWGLNVTDIGTNTGGAFQFASDSNQFQQPWTFQTGPTNGAPVHFQSNLWRQITLTYSPTNIALYTNGMLVATGDLPPQSGGIPDFAAGNGVAFYPSASAQATGFSFGCLPGQPCAVRGQLDELESFNYPLTPEEVAAGFPTTAGSTNINVMLDSDYDGRSDFLETQVDGTNPRDPNSVVHCRLGYWRFDSENLMAEQGQLPLSCNNISLVPDWSGTALNITSDPASEVTYWDVFTNGWANINCRQGCLRFWFKPNWTGSPPLAAPFVYLGSADTESSQWTLGVNSSGAITFVTASNSIATTNLTSLPLVFDSNHWTQIALNYGASGTSLYVNGTLAAAGAPVASWPDLADRNLGMVIGNTTACNNAINGQFDEMETFNYPLDAGDIATNFQAVQMFDSDLDGVADLLEDIVLPVSRPFLGRPTVITGTVEAEQFDLGGPGVGYFSVAGNPPSAYRPTGLFITNCDDLGLGYCLDQTRAGDWAQYTINVLAPQTYTIETRAEGIGANGVFECEFVNNNFYTNTGPLTINSAQWTNISAVVWLTNGVYTMKLHCLTNGSDGAHVGRFNYISLYPSWPVGFASATTNVVDNLDLSTNDDFDDAINNAAVIQGAIDALPASGGTILLPAGTYYVSQTSPNETNDAYANAAISIVTNNIDIAGAGKTNTTLIAYNRATTIFYLGSTPQRIFGLCSNFTLRDLTLKAEPHRAVLNGTNTTFELGELQPVGFENTASLTAFQGLNGTQFAQNILITNCQFLNADVSITLIFALSNCLITHCDFNIWGGKNVYTGFSNNLPTNTVDSVGYRGSVGIFAGGSPVYNINIVENTYNGNTNLVANPNHPFGYVNTNIFQFAAPDGFVYCQSGGNYFVARNIISNNALEGVQLGGGPNSVVGNTYSTLVNDPSCCALDALNGGFFGLTGNDPVNYSTCFIGNQVFGDRNGELVGLNVARLYFITISGNCFTLDPPLPQQGDSPGAVIGVQYCTSANILGNTLVSGGHGAVFGLGCGSAIIMNNDFAGATYRGIGLTGGGASLQNAIIVNNIVGQGSTFHAQLPWAASFGWFLDHNTWLDASSNSVPPFLDPAASAVHVSDF